MARYSRHLKIPEVGKEGQLKLLKSKVLLVGAGGLGSPAAVYLAASGVGTLGLVDNDVVDESNLQRQILHWSSSIGIPKTDSARQTLFEVNPDVKVQTYNLRLDASNALDILGGYDVIVSGSDNFATAYLVNDAAVILGKPVASGSIFRFDGQASTFIPTKDPATAVSTRWRRRRSSRRAVTKRACSGCCRDSSASSRRQKPSSCCATSEIRCPDD